MNILCRMLEANASDEQLKDVSGLIYDTDPYIYPALFRSREEALEIIPKMFKAGDCMFSVENVFVAECQKRIVGIILWHKGPLNWNKTQYYLCGGYSPYLDDVSSRYFFTYSTVPDDTISIINVSSSIKGIGIGTNMFRSFLNKYPGKHELYVLADNEHAISLYQRFGFIIESETNGYSIDNQNLPCYRMISNQRKDKTKQGRKQLACTL